MTTLIGAVAIGRLCLFSRQRAHAMMNRGVFGPVVRIGHLHYVELDRVEAYYRRRFTRDQVEAAARSHLAVLGEFPQ